ncbi:MAG TPA: dihydrodipicolinate synthase family protein [Gemmatimonadales bacterium]|jgi:dihydrodipicolinate synthase/N-acetylneuraminate lyase|nr:dihydrodipicolinate synthase family protein [Gemmatimonadales bacterium]
MQQRDWAGVLPAITTPFKPDLTIDEPALAAHVRWMLDSGCRGIVALGSLGESATLTTAEKVRILETCREAMGSRGYLVAGIAGLATSECVALAKAAEKAGCDALMALPAYVYVGDGRETEAHYGRVLGATGLSCMLYNNPIAYGVNVSPEQLMALCARYPNLHAIKESSGSVRRVAAIRSALRERIRILVGMDDVVVESVAMGAVGWVAGLVNALPVETVRLFDLAISGKAQEAWALYDWFLPLLRLDTVPKFVQLIKLVQQELGKGSARVRPPRLELEGEELAQMKKLIQDQLSRRPA